MIRGQKKKAVLGRGDDHQANDDHKKDEASSMGMALEAPQAQRT